MYKTLDFAFHISSAPTFLYFDLYLNTAYAAHYVYFTICYLFCFLCQMVPPRGSAYVQMTERDVAYRALNSRKIQRLIQQHTMFISL